MLMKEKLTIRQFTLLTFLVMIGDMVLIYPSLVTAVGKQDAWFCSLVSLPIGVGIMWVLYTLHRTHPQLSLFEISKKVLGTWAGSVLSVAYLFYFAIGAAICVREVGDFLTTQIYLKTPIRVIILMIICTLAWGLIHGFRTIGLSSELLTPVVLVFIISLYLGLLPQAESANLQRYFSTPWIHLVESIFRAAFTSFGELIVLSVFLPYVNSGPHFKRDFLLATLFGGLLLSLLLLISLMVMGPILTQHSIYISYALSQKINIGNFFERIEAFMAISWLISTYFKSLLYLFAFVLGTAQLFRLKTYKPLILPSSLLLFALGVLIAPNVIFYTTTIMPAWVDWDITVSFIIPLFLLLVHRIRSRKRKQSNSL